MGIPDQAVCNDQKYTGKPISVDFQNTDISVVIRILSEVGGFNYAIDPSVRGTPITIKLTDVPWDQALDVILAHSGLQKTWETSSKVAGAGQRTVRVFFGDQ